MGLSKLIISLRRFDRALAAYPSVGRDPHMTIDCATIKPSNFADR